MQLPPSSGPFGAILDAKMDPARTEGDYELVLDAQEMHERDGGILHGGVMMSLLDMAMAGAVGRLLEPGETCASASITTDFLRAGKRGRLVARGRVSGRGKRTAFPSAELLDADGVVIARASGVWAIRSGRR